MKDSTRILLRNAASQIKQLRSSNEVMSARLDMFDKMWMLFNTEPNYQRQGASEDICFQIEKHIESE